MTSRWRIIKRI